MSGMATGSGTGTGTGVSSTPTAVGPEVLLVYASIYLLAVRAGGFICELVKLSPIIGELIIGALLSPLMIANFVPYPKAFQLCGLLGIQLAVIEAGIVTDMDDLKKLAPRGLLIAVMGIILPILFSFLVVWGIFEGTALQAFSAGAAVAPTSLGVVAKLLKEEGELETDLGKIISMAAVFDDVLSLILLSFLETLKEPKAGDPAKTPWTYASPLVYALIFVVGALIASAFVPKIVIPLMAQVPEDYRDKFALLCLFLFALLLTQLANMAATSFLLGGYLAGIAFASVSIIPDVYEKQVKRIMYWTARLFFSATIAFEVPLKVMFTGKAIGLGLCLGLIGVFGKVICGLGTYPRIKEDSLAVGVAMLGRGEFGFLIAAQALKWNLINGNQAASAYWGVLIPTLVTPILFGPVFRRRKRLYGEEQEDENLDSPNNEPQKTASSAQVAVAVHTNDEES